MKKNDVKKPKGLSFPYESLEDKQKRMEAMEKRWAIARKLGVDLTAFDNDDIDSLIFKTQKEKRQYEADTLMLSALLNAGKEIPKDLQERLLRVKKLREQLKIQGI